MQPFPSLEPHVGAPEHKRCEAVRGSGSYGAHARPGPTGRWTECICRDPLAVALGARLSCEMCGKSLPLVATIEVEGARMRVCQGCQRFGRVVPQPGPAAGPARQEMASRLARRQTRMTEKPVPLETEEDLVEDFGERVRKAREQKRLSLDDVARAINEKKSLLHKIETEHFFPDLHVTKKLEAALGVSLRERVEAVHTEKLRPRGGLTIGDLIRMQKE
jgi:putative transcription factor